ncbi:MAG: hypothetical protein RLY86_975 [Pseudomonadota bacterium]|jgi:hypothetical protein
MYTGDTTPPSDNLIRITALPGAVPGSTGGDTGGEITLGTLPVSGDGSLVIGSGVIDLADFLDADALAELLSTGNFKELQARLWSVPEYRDLMGSLGFDGPVDLGPDEVTILPVDLDFSGITILPADFDFAALFEDMFADAASMDLTILGALPDMATVDFGWTGF